jgi:hypothetical protein
MVEFVHTGLPMCGLAAVAASVKLRGDKRRRLHAVYAPWAVQAGLRCAPLLSLRYEHHFEEELESLRSRWRIVPAPLFPSGGDNRTARAKPHQPTAGVDLTQVERERGKTLTTEL